MEAGGGRVVLPPSTLRTVTGRSELACELKGSFCLWIWGSGCGGTFSSQFPELMTKSNTLAASAASGPFLASGTLSLAGASNALGLSSWKGLNLGTIKTQEKQAEAWSRSC